MARTGRKVTRRVRSNSRGTATRINMRDSSCSSLVYRFKVALEKFDIDAFRRAANTDATVKHAFHVVNTRDFNVADYHAHLDWRIREKQQEVAIEIKYVASPVKPVAGDQEPFSDNLMKWIGRFFKYGDANARIHSDVAFDAKKSTLSWFPLPMRTKVSALLGEAILDGVSVALPSQPDGVSRFFLSHIKDTVLVAIESERRIKFSNFSLAKELQVVRSFADKLIEVKS